MVRSVEELQDTLVKSLMLPDLLDFLKECEGKENKFCSCELPMLCANHSCNIKLQT